MGVFTENLLQRHYDPGLPAVIMQALSGNTYDSLGKAEQPALQEGLGCVSISMEYILSSRLISSYPNEITELGFGAGSNTRILILF